MGSSLLLRLKPCSWVSICPRTVNSLQANRLRANHLRATIVPPFPMCYAVHYRETPFIVFYNHPALRTTDGDRANGTTAFIIGSITKRVNCGTPLHSSSSDSVCSIGVGYKKINLPFEQAAQDEPCFEMLGKHHLHKQCVDCWTLVHNIIKEAQWFDIWSGLIYLPYFELYYLNDGSTI